MSRTEVEVRFGQDGCGEEEVSAHRLFLCGGGELSFVPDVIAAAAAGLPFRSPLFTPLKIAVWLPVAVFLAWGHQMLNAFRAR